MWDLPAPPGSEPRVDAAMDAAMDAAVDAAVLRDAGENMDSLADMLQEVASLRAENAQLKGQVVFCLFVIVNMLLASVMIGFSSVCVDTLFSSVC